MYYTHTHICYALVLFAKNNVFTNFSTIKYFSKDHSSKTYSPFKHNLFVFGYKDTNCIVNYKALFNF